MAAEVLSSVGGDGLEVHANMDWCRMAKPMGAWQRGRRAGRPARFEPQERTRIVARSSAEPLAGKICGAEPLAGRVLLVPHAESLTGTLAGETRKPELAF